MDRRHALKPAGQVRHHRRLARAGIAGQEERRRALRISEPILNSLHHPVSSRKALLQAGQVRPEVDGPQLSEETCVRALDALIRPEMQGFSKPASAR